ncbi:recombinase family protein [Microgenomates group bacterium]|nr:recombinase family protein [Microgenomates group bacterium]
MKRVVALLRVSTTKQKDDGDSPERQLEEIKHFIGKKDNWQIVEVFELAESASEDSGERKAFNKMMEYCLNKVNDIDVVVFKNISRFTRDGSEAYFALKNKLANEGIAICDAAGVISEETINTMEKWDLEYKWSVFGKSEGQEGSEADKWKDNKRDVLTQLIGAEAYYVQAGYPCQKAPYGLKNVHVETVKHGKRATVAENKDESYYVKQMFELAAQGLTVKKITEQVNILGARSRPRNMREKSETKKGRIVGVVEPRPLIESSVDYILKNTIYAGVMVHKMNHRQPIKALEFDGIIDVELFNKANVGYQKIVIEGEKVKLLFGKECEAEEHKRQRNRHNPLYPYKSVVRCPICKGKFLGSAAYKKKIDKKYPQYHCHKGHKTWSMPAEAFNEAVESFIKDVKLDDGIMKLHDALFYEEYEAAMAKNDVMAEKVDAELEKLEKEQEVIYQNIKATSIQSVRMRLEADYDDCQRRIDIITTKRHEQERQRLDVKKALRYGRFLIEHLEKLLIDSDNIQRQEQLFGLLFDEVPTIEEILNRTAKLSLSFAYKDGVIKGEIQECWRTWSRTTLSEV